MTPLSLLCGRHRAEPDRRSREFVGRLPFAPPPGLRLRPNQPLEISLGSNGVRVLHRGAVLGVIEDAQARHWLGTWEGVSARVGHVGTRSASLNLYRKR